MKQLTSDVGSDDLGADVVLEKAGDILVILVPLLEPEVELGSGNRVEASEFQRKVGGDGRRSRQGQEGSEVGSNFEGNPGREGDLRDGRGSNGRRICGSSAKLRGESLGKGDASGIGGVDGDFGSLWNGREGGGTEGGNGQRGHRGSSSGSWLTSGSRREETVGTRAKVWGIGDESGPAGSTLSLPALFSDEAESGDVDVAILIEGHLRKLFGEGYRRGKRFGEGRATQEGLPSSLEENQLVDVGKGSEEEGQTRIG